MAARDRNFVERGTKLDTESLEEDRRDPLVKNPWKWSWLDYTHKNQKLSDSFRLIKKAGFVVCIVCDKECKYSNRGRVALTDHLDSAAHSKVLKMRASNTLLPGKLTICSYFCFVIVNVPFFQFHHIFLAVIRTNFVSQKCL